MRTPIKTSLFSSTHSLAYIQGDLHMETVLDLELRASGQILGLILNYTGNKIGECIMQANKM